MKHTPPTTVGDMVNAEHTNAVMHIYFAEVRDHELNLLTELSHEINHVSQNWLFVISESVQ